jgi:hypothetical protein
MTIKWILKNKKCHTSNVIKYITLRLLKLIYKFFTFEIKKIEFYVNMELKNEKSMSLMK